VIGAVVANSDQGDDTIELATPETTEPADTTDEGSDDATDATPGPTPTTPPTTVPITTPPTLPAVTESATAVTPVGNSPTEEVAQVLPWRDGFLSIGFQFEPRPLLPLDDEIVALFPEEVVGLFPEGLPPTIDEAFQALDEAGLLDEVTDVLAEHPEASSAIYGEEPPPPAVMANYTVDGAEWSTTELSVPARYPGQFTVSGDRLIMWSSEPVGSPEDFTGPQQLTIAATTDLESWQTATIVLDVEPPESPAIQTDVSVNSFAVVGDRWLAHITRHSWLDHESLLPDDVRLELQTAGMGYGINQMEDRLEVEVFAEDGSVSVEYSFTWAELGLEGEPDPGPGEGDVTMLTGVFGGDHEEIPAPPVPGFGAVASLGDQFVLLGDTAVGSAARVSPDGRTWTDLEGLPDVEFWQTVVPVTGGHLFVGDGRSGPVATLRLDDGTFTDVAMPELPDRYGIWDQSGSSAWIVEVGEPPQPDWDPLEIVIEQDGFVLTVLEGPDGSTYTLTDATSGEVVRNETFGHVGDGPEIWEYDDENDQSWIVIRDDDAAEIVRIPGEVFDEAIQAAFEANEPERTVVTDEEFNAWQPDLWMIATGDGVNWITVDLDVPEPEMGFWPQGAAVNDGSVLYQGVDGWVLEALPT
jgi:hypothetical protein